MKEKFRQHTARADLHLGATEPLTCSVATGITEHPFFIIPPTAQQPQTASLTGEIHHPGFSQ